MKNRGAAPNSSDGTVLRDCQGGRLRFVCFSMPPAAPLLPRIALLMALAMVGMRTLEAHELVKTTHTYKTVGAVAIRADVYRATVAGVRPAILWIHGGALIMGSRAGLHPDQAKRYLDAGYTIIAIDYRLAPQVKLAQILTDLEDAYRWVRAEGPTRWGIDPDRIAVMGHSAGGYLSLTAGFLLRPRPAAIVAFYGYGDIASEWYSRPDPFYRRQPLVTREAAVASIGDQVVSEDFDNHRSRFYLYTRQQGLWPLEVAGHDPDREPRAFDRFCPLRHVTPDYPPTVLLHGDDDTDVPFAQSVLMAEAFQRERVPHDFIRMAGRGHGFDGAMGDPVVIGAFDRTIAFLNARLRP